MTRLRMPVIISSMRRTSSATLVQSRRGANAMRTVLMTGAAGGIGTRLRRLLKGVYPQLRLSDLKTPSDLAADETFVAADLADLSAVERIVEGVDGIVHLGGYSIE